MEKPAVEFSPTLPLLEIGPYSKNFSQTSSLETKNGKLPIHTILAGGFLGDAEGVSYRCTRVVKKVLDAPTTMPNLIYKAVCGTKVCFISFLCFWLWCWHVDNSSDVIQDMWVNVFEENSQKVIWYKVCTFFPSLLFFALMTMQGKVLGR